MAAASLLYRRGHARVTPAMQAYESRSEQGVCGAGLAVRPTVRAREPRNQGAREGGARAALAGKVRRTPGSDSALR